MSAWMYYLLGTLLLLSNSLGFVLNVASLPGNWWIVVGSALFSALVYSNGPDGQPYRGIHWQVVAVLVGLALVGELIEFAAGMVGAAKVGASRRAMILSIVGSILGSLVGAFVGMPIPVVGSAVAGVLGGAIGAAVGAIVGEDWKGRDLDGSFSVGAAAFWGRLFGTLGKAGVSAVMLVIATVDTFW